MPVLPTPCPLPAHSLLSASLHILTMETRSFFRNQCNRPSRLVLSPPLLLSLLWLECSFLPQLRWRLVTGTGEDSDSACPPAERALPFESRHAGVLERGSVP